MAAAGEMMRSTESKNRRPVTNEHGFTLIETTIAMTIMLIAGLGVLSLFTYSIGYNSGANDRAVAISIDQQQIEQLRGVQLTASILNASTAPVVDPDTVS